MKSKLISFILALCLLIAVPLSALYKYNPFTRKLDYYELGTSWERTIVVAKSGGNYTTIQAAIDYAYAEWGAVTDYSNPVVILVAPGKYEEQIFSYDGYYIISYATGWYTVPRRSAATLYNTGASSATYPFSPTDGNVVQMRGFNIETDNGGVFGKIMDCGFNNSTFTEGHFIDQTVAGVLTARFQGSYFYASDYSGFYLTSSDNTLPQIEIKNCIMVGTPTFSGTHSGGSVGVAIKNTTIEGHLDISGNWDSIIEITRTFGEAARNEFDTAGSITVQDSICENGINFSSAPVSFKMINSSFKGPGTNYIPGGEGDITSDVIIATAPISGNTMQNGMDGEIQIDSTTKKVGGTDSYLNIEEAIKACVSGDTVRLSVGEYNETVTLPAGVNINGAERGSCIIYSNTGTVLTKTTGISRFDKVTLRSTPVSGTTDAHLIDQSGGELHFTNSNLEISPTETYADGVVLSAGLLTFDITEYDYTNITSGGGTHNLFKMTGTSAVEFFRGQVDVTIVDDDDLNVFNDAGSCTVECGIRGSELHINLTDGAYSSEATFYRAEGVGKTIHVDTNHFHAECSGNGTGQILYVDSTAGGMSIMSNANHYMVMGFTNNYLSQVAAGDELITHSDDIIAASGYIGAGTYEYASSFAGGQFSVSEKLLVGDGTTNYMDIDSAGDITLYGTARVLKTKSYEGTSLRSGTSGAADVNNMRVHNFDDTITETSFFSFIIPDDYDATAAPSLKIYIYPAANRIAGSACVMRIDEARYIATGESTAKAADETNLSNTVTVDNVQYITVTFTQALDNSKIAAGDTATFLLTRQSAAGAPDDRNGDIALFMVEFIYTSNKL